MLLVLDLPRPEDSEHLATDLSDSWRSSAAYLILFVTVGLLWIEHVGMISALHSLNRRFLDRVDAHPVRSETPDARVPRVDIGR